MHAVEMGRPGRQVALLIHGWSSSWYAVSPLLDLLAQRFHCIAIDLPGYGESPPMKQRATITSYAELMAALIEQVTNGPVVLVGHSMGGMISLALAQRYPLLVDRMVLISPTISGRLSTFINLFVTPITLMERFGLGSLIVSSVERTVVGITDRLVRPASFAERSGITKRDYERIRHDVRRPGQGRVRAECYQAMRDNDLRGRLGDHLPPALVLWGAEDNTVPLRDAGVVADEWPEADLRIMPKAGHWPHFEMPDVVRRLVAAYLGLPRFSDQLHTSAGEQELIRVKEAAQFLAHSDLGNNLNLNQRARLAAQCKRRIYSQGEAIVRATEAGQDLYIVWSGTVEVLKKQGSGSAAPSSQATTQAIDTVRPGQVTGEFAMLDRGARSADIVAGDEGAVVLTLRRDRLLALCEDDAVLGTILLWNIATAVSRRARYILWQLSRAEQRKSGPSIDELEKTIIGKMPFIPPTS